jgi:hypothetical protein
MTAYFGKKSRLLEILGRANIGCQGLRAAFLGSGVMHCLCSPGRDDSFRSDGVWESLHFGMFWMKEYTALANIQSMIRINAGAWTQLVDTRLYSEPQQIVLFAQNSFPWC